MVWLLSIEDEPFIELRLSSISDSAFSVTFARMKKKSYQSSHVVALTTYNMPKFAPIEFSLANCDKLGMGGIAKFLSSYRDAGLNSCWLSESESSDADEWLADEHLESLPLVLSFAFWSSFAFTFVY